MDTLTIATTQMCIYKITNIINKKSYIGQARNKVSIRWARHIKLDTKKPSVIQKAIHKYGIDSFKFEIIAIADSLKELDYKEQVLIQVHNTLFPNGYNIQTGGGQGFHYSAEHRKRLSIAAKHKAPEIYSNHSIYMRSRMNSPEMKVFMADTARRVHTGRKQSKEHIEHRARLKRGSTLTDEQKITLARAHMNGKIIVCSNGKEYLSAYEASIDTGAIKDHIGSICNGKRKSSKGFTFNYKVANHGRI